MNNNIGQSGSNLKAGETRFILEDDATRGFLCGVIEQAVQDFLALVAAARIVDGTVAPGNGMRVAGYRTDAEVQALLDFFNSRMMDEWIALAGIRINPNQVREKLGLKHQSYDIHPG